MKKQPTDILYGVDDKPPPLILFLSSLQVIAVTMPTMVYVVVLCRTVNAQPEVTTAVISFTILAMGVGTALQAFGRGVLGNGYLCPTHPTGGNLPPALLAANLGGLPMVFGMTIFMGVFQMALANVVHRLRPFFPPEIAGLVILLMGFNATAIGIRLYMKSSPGGSPSMDAGVILALSLGTMIALNIWTRGTARALCALIGLAVGYGVAASMGLVTAQDFTVFRHGGFVSIPQVRHIAFSFDAALAIPFMVVALAGSLKAIGVTTMCQKLNDADWVRPNLMSVRGGVFGEGLGTVISGALGGYALNVSPGGVAVSAASGVASRYVGFAIGALLGVGAFFPVISAVLAAIPSPLMAASIAFTSCFLMAHGMQAITSRMLDSRKIFVIGLAIIGALVVEILPGLFKDVSPLIRPIFGSSMVFGTVLALLFNLLFRIGVKQRVEMVYDPGEDTFETLDDFLDEQGAKWGARRDIIERANFALHQLTEAVTDHCQVRAPIRIQASFDEFSLDIALSYQGDLLELPQQRPLDAEIRESEDGLRRLAGFMLRRNADRAQAEMAGETAVIRFHFDH